MGQTQEEINEANITRSKVDQVARQMGHELVWKLGPHSDRRGCSYHFIGQCLICGAQIAADAAGPSCFGDRDALKWKCTQSALIDYVTDSRAKQGVPPKVQDEATLRRVAGLIQPRRAT